MNKNKKLAIGILAHVDAGKTTLSEAMLYQSGTLKKLGRVDHQDAFLDTYQLERDRGITIFSKQAILPFHNMEITLLDTPGHVDFSCEMERTLQVLDYAILVINGSDGVQGHIQTLWQLLARHHIPTFLFVNKMDLDGTDPDFLLKELKLHLSENCISFSNLQDQEKFFENVSLCDESVLNHYLEFGKIDSQQIASLIRHRKLFPCYFGSALKLLGIEEFLNGLEQYTEVPLYPEQFGAKVYKISRDPQGHRLTYLKITGGSLSVKTLLSNSSATSKEKIDSVENKIWQEKVDQIRIYSGAKYQMVDTVNAGTVCAVTGLSHTYAGEGLGIETTSESPMLEPVLTYQVILPYGYDAHSALSKLSQLEEEDPQLHIVWNERLHEIHIQLMGEVQLEVLKQLILQRFGLCVEFGAGNIIYRETIAKPVEGVGHFEPLRHYAEVHLLLEPGEPRSGLHFDSVCSEDVLDKNWQRLILTHLEEKIHVGVLTGSPITDMKITLVAGKAHLKHTEGGDFRQATYRALRQGLMSAQNILLEPYYRFRLEVPTSQIGRAMTDLQKMHGQFSPPETVGENSVLTGSAPVSTMQGYAMEVTGYTKGHGKLFCTLKGYEPCHNQEEVIQEIGYQCERDLQNPADSVFCSHGAGFVVKWDQVRKYMHIDSGLKFEEEKEAVTLPLENKKRSFSYSGSFEEDEELKAIFERTYGPTKRKSFYPQKQVSGQERQEKLKSVPIQNIGPEYLLVDGYNIIFAWEDLKKIAQENLDAARQLLMDLLCNYQGFKKCVVILVFDAYKVPRNMGEVVSYHNIHVVYTKEAETADAYIEKATYKITKNHRVRVATSDSTIQLIILGHGALRISAKSFREEIDSVNQQISSILKNYNQKEKSDVMEKAMLEAQKKNTR